MARLAATTLPAAVDPAVEAAVISAFVSVALAILTSLYLERRRHRAQLQADYEYEQRRALRTLIGQHHGRLLDHATSWHYRMLNIYLNVGEGWLSVKGDYTSSRYYFRSTVYRFLALEAAGQLFENRQIFIDARFGGERDLDFVKFVKAMHWVMSDAALFEGLGYDINEGEDHFTADLLRTDCEAFMDDGNVPSYRAFEVRLAAEVVEQDVLELDEVFQFFDALSPHEDRFRWDRLVCLHLFTMAFMRAFGYEWLRPSDDEIKGVVERLKHPVVARNLVAWLPRLGLADNACLNVAKNALQKRAQTVKLSP